LATLNSVIEALKAKDEGYRILKYEGLDGKIYYAKIERPSEEIVLRKSLFVYKIQLLWLSYN